MIINSYQFASGGGFTEYPSGARFAVSLRELPGLSYTGKLIRVRRSSDNAELDFYQGATEYSWNTTRGGGGTDLVTWIGANTGYVTELFRQDGSSGKLTQTTAGNQPIIISSGTLLTSGGYPCILFNSAATNWMSIDTTTPPSNLVPHTSFVVGNRTASAKYGLTMSRYDSTDGWSIARWGDNKVYQRTTDGQDGATNTNTTTSFEILAAWATASNFSMDTDAGNIAAGHTETSYGTINFNEYGRWDKAGVISDFNLVEHVYYQSDKSSDYQDIIDFMKGEFGL
jgi:hypothetical protein